MSNIILPLLAIAVAVAISSCCCYYCYKPLLLLLSQSRQSRRLFITYQYITAYLYGLYGLYAYLRQSKRLSNLHHNKELN